MFGVKVTLSCFKQLPLNYTLIFELCHFSFGERLLFDVVGGLIVSFENPLDCHATTVSLRPSGIVKVFKIGWNVKKCCDPSLKK